MKPMFWTLMLFPVFIDIVCVNSSITANLVCHIAALHVVDILVSCVLINPYVCVCPSEEVL